MILNKRPLNYSTPTCLDDDILDYLAKFVVVSYNKPLSKRQIRNQFEFLAQTVSITMSDYQKFVVEQQYIRTRFDSIIKEYEIGWFKKSGITLLKLSVALTFKKIDEQQPYLHFALTPELLDYIEKLEDL